jgi:hypothetical protein
MQLITLLAWLHLPTVLTHFLGTGAHHDLSSGASEGKESTFPYAPSTTQTQKSPQKEKLPCELQS